MQTKRSVTTFITACNHIATHTHLNGFLSFATIGPALSRFRPCSAPIASYCSSATAGTLPTVNRVPTMVSMPTYTRRLKDAWSEEDIRDIPESLRPEKGETLELILRKRIYLLQSRRGYRANTDSQLLAFFASKYHVRGQGTVRALDLGAGNGLVAVLFGRSRQAASLTLLELQPPLASRARRNLALNDLDGVVHCHDLGNGLPPSFSGCFDAVLMNPPFYAPNTRSPPRRIEKRLAHIESSADINQFCAAAANALRKSSTSRLYAIYDLREMNRLAVAIGRAGLRIVATQQVRHSDNEAPTRILVSAGHVDEVKEERVQLNEMCLHPPGTNLYEYNQEMEQFMEELPPATLRIGQLRP